MNHARPSILVSLLFIPACVGGGLGPSSSSSSETTDAADGLEPAPDAGDDGGATTLSDLPPMEAGAPVPFDATAVPPPLSDAGADADPDAQPSGASDASLAEAGAEASCMTPLGPGVLAIDELMVESVAGSGDYGQWLEVRNVTPCPVDLRGLQGACATGSKVYTFDVAYDLWVDGGDYFVVADSADPVINHNLPGTILTWMGAAGGALRHEGATITLSAGQTLVDTLTYPSLKWTVGASLAFPASCPLSSRSDFTNWQTSTASWFPGFFGTPNAPNTDVLCP